jgi:hypothetical protein
LGAFSAAVLLMMDEKKSVCFFELKDAVSAELQIPVGTDIDHALNRTLSELVVAGLIESSSR